MLKFKNEMVASVIDAVSTVGAKIDASQKTTQAILNSLQLSRKLPNDIIVIGTVNGLIVSRDAGVNVDNPIVFTEESLIEFSDSITPDLYHKTNDQKAEFRYYPALRQILRVVNKVGNDTTVADDDHNIFKIPADVKSISAKQSVVPIFFPNLIKDREEAEAKISASNSARGMDTIKPGDSVILRHYADMASEFGDEEVVFGYNNETMRISGNIRGASTIVLTDHASHYGGKQFVVDKVLNERQEIILRTPLTEIINPVTGETLPNEMPIRFSKLHFVKA